MNNKLLTEAAEKLLERVAKAIEKHPKQVNMDMWFSSFIPEQDPADRSEPCRLRPAGGCGTAACIAGWILHVINRKKTLSDTEYLVKSSSANEIESEAAAAIGLSGYDANHLFRAHMWPDKFADRLTASEENPPLYAKVVADRIRYFIKKGK